MLARGCVPKQQMFLVPEDLQFGKQPCKAQLWGIRVPNRTGGKMVDKVGQNLVYSIPEL